VGAAEALGGSTHDRLKNTFGIFIEFAVPEAKNDPALLPKEFVSTSVVRRFCVLAAVKLHDQFCLTTREVCSERSNR
jgi:hypothetical protein